MAGSLNTGDLTCMGDVNILIAGFGSRTFSFVTLAGTEAINDLRLCLFVSHAVSFGSGHCGSANFEIDKVDEYRSAKFLE